MGQEGHVPQVGTQGHEVFGLKRLGVHGQGRARFPQGPQLAADLVHRGVGGAGVVGRADAGARIRHRAESGHQHGPDLGLLTPLGRVGEAGGERCLTVLNPPSADQAVAVEPVLGRAARPAELGRAVAIEAARQTLRRSAVDQPQGARRHVALDVGGGQRPVSRRRHRLRSIGPVGGQDAGGCERGGAHEQGAAGRGHGEGSHSLGLASGLSGCGWSGPWRPTPRSGRGPTGPDPCYPPHYWRRRRARSACRRGWCPSCRCR
ncbi:hypothetical protein D3C72_1044580 [compost metagenome]